MKKTIFIIALLLSITLHGQELRNKISINTLHLLLNTYNKITNLTNYGLYIVLRLYRP